MSGLNRRTFNKLALGGLAGALAGPSTRVRAAEGDYERKFLVVFAEGGWDYGYVFAPLFDNEYYAADPSSEEAETNGITFVHAESRPAVAQFFEAYGDKACIINGMEVRSITHDRCTRIVFTGGTSNDSDDFASIIAAHTQRDLLLPHMVLSGPSYTTQYASQVVRQGVAGQLPDLLDGSSLLDNELVYMPSPATHESRIDEFVRSRAELQAELQHGGRRGRVDELHARVLQQLDGLGEISDQVTFSDSGGVDTQVDNALGLLELGVTRCATVEHKGLYNLGWDTHSDNTKQDDHFQLLFTLLNRIMSSMAGRTGEAGGPLSDEVTVVVISEMGRNPSLNSYQGKHHWTFTSAMLIGSGVQGGQVLGEFDEFCTGKPIDLDSGEVHDEGASLVPGHLGATLMAMADVDWAEYLDAYAPIGAAIEGVVSAVWVVLLACTSGMPSQSGVTPSDSEADDPSEETQDYEAGPKSFDAEAAGRAIEEALVALRTITSDVPIAGYGLAISGRDSDCPNYFESEQGHAWDGVCTAASGTSYAGAFTAYTYDRTYLSDEDVWYFPAGMLTRKDSLWTGGGMIGQAAINLPDDSHFRASGVAVFLEGTRKSGEREFFNHLSPPVIWVAGAEDTTWQSQGADPTSITAAWREQADGSWEFSAQCDLGGLSEPYTTVSLGIEGPPSASESVCELEPWGRVEIREAGTGYWFQLDFDGQLETGMVPEDCDGCGEMTFDGEVVGEVCVDFRLIYDWEDSPW